MEFTEFAKKIKSVIGGDQSTHLFTRTIFEEIITDEGAFQLEEISDNTFKAYFNGKTGITNISKKISIYIEPEKFATYLDQFSDPVKETLCEIFRPNIKDITPHNAEKEIAYLFQKILVTAASQNRKSTPKSANKEKINIEEYTSEKYPYSDEDYLLLKEFNSDFEEITLLIIGDNLGSILLERTIINNLANLYNSKWKDKASEFSNPTLKSYAFALLGEFHSLNTLLLSDENKPYEIKQIQSKMQNLYIKLHPDRFDISFPYAAFIDDWDEI